MENGPVTTGVLADMMEVSPASANEVIGKLGSRGLAEYEKYKDITPTDDGIAHACGALQTYYITERFLSNILGVEEFHARACELEPVIDGMIAERLNTIIDRNSEYPDCFDPETDVCEYLDAYGMEPEAGTEAVD